MDLTVLSEQKPPQEQNIPQSIQPNEATLFGTFDELIQNLSTVECTLSEEEANLLASYGCKIISLEEACQ